MLVLKRYVFFKLFLLKVNKSFFCFSYLDKSEPTYFHWVSGCTERARAQLLVKTKILIPFFSCFYQLTHIFCHMSESRENVILDTSMGSIHVELYWDHAPK